MFVGSPGKKMEMHLYTKGGNEYFFDAIAIKSWLWGKILAYIGDVGQPAFEKVTRERVFIFLVVINSKVL